MNEKALHVLEYPKIIEKLTGYAGSEMGKELCQKTLPSTDPEEIHRRQTQTSDALARIYAAGSISFAGLKEIRGSLLRLLVGSSLNIPELLDICSVLDVTQKAKNYGQTSLKARVNTTRTSADIRMDTPGGGCADPDASDHTDTDITDSLSPYFLLLEPLPSLSREIRRCILSEEEIADDASAGLKAVRRSIRQTNDRIHSQLTTLVNSQSMSAKLQDTIVTMRGGRYCLPVKAEYRSQVPGMIHDQSSSGSTLFIEPMAVVQLNNTLRELEIREKEEIEKVLAALSQEAAGFADELKGNVDALVQLDEIFARAAFSRSYHGTEPHFNEDGYINIKKARHPLLQAKKAVPIDITLGKDFKLLIVTGPNTGGKTVSLKTVGLFTLMGQAGLHIPAFDHSELAIFDDVFADIGDEQSIEQSLSTFSSHMTNIIKIIDAAGSRSLVLLDELCAGTDPTEGAALAISILEYLLQRGVTTMATTHYSELKVFALSRADACNASCEFDVATLSPTYRLLIGIPGKSNAFAISEKLGLPKFMIENARRNIDAADQSFEDLLSDLEDSRHAIEQERETLSAYKEEVTVLQKQLQEKQESLMRQREQILRDANTQAAHILSEAKNYADETIREMNRLSAGTAADRKAMETRRSEVRKKADAASAAGNRPGTAAAAADKRKKLRPEDLHPGDSVYVRSMGLRGTIASDDAGGGVRKSSAAKGKNSQGKAKNGSNLVDSRGTVLVQMGILKSRIPLSDLEPADEEDIKAPVSLTKTGAGRIRVDKSSSVSTSINLIGKTVDEALPELEKYLDDAYLAHLPQVTVIHGRGTGKLRSAIHQRLRKMSHVESFRLGTFGEGETGVTIVTFKE